MEGDDSAYGKYGTGSGADIFKKVNWLTIGCGLKKQFKIGSLY